MKRFEIILIGIAFLLLALPGAVAQDDDFEDTPKLIAQGEGMATVPADEVTIVLGVETRDESAAQAAAANAVAMNATIQALVDAGVDREDIQTSQFTIRTLDERDVIPFAERIEDEDEDEADNVTPIFVVTNQVIINTTELDMVGEILDAAIAAGTNRVQSVTFGLENDSDATDMALTDAVDDAQRRAQVMADAAEVNLSRIIEISGGYSFAQPRAEAVSFSLAGGAAPTTPVLPGDVDVTASVTVTYEIE